MKKVIAFTGKKLNGKTTASNYLMRRFLSESDTPIKVERINMKDSIVEEMKEYFPGTLEFIGAMYEMDTDTLFKEKPGGMRKLMQDFGLMRRLEDTDYWVKKWEAKIKASNSDVIITDDVRFLNEQEAINRVGGKLYKVIREGLESDDHHATEREIDEIQCEEIHAKDKEELFTKLDQIRL